MATDGMAFGAVLRRLRLAAGLTQERLAERAGVSAKAIIALENDPARMPRLETVSRLADALSLDRDGRASLLGAARPERLAVAAPESMMQPRPELIDLPTSIRREAVGPGLASAELEPTSREEWAEEPEPIPRSPVVLLAHHGEDWGEAPDVAKLRGRARELATLGRWVGADGCRLVAIVGMGGIGKTSLAARLARELARDFDAVYWRSVRNAPPPADWLGGAILFLSDQQVLPGEGEEARLRQLLELLQARRVLLVLDNLETVLEPGAPEVRYRAGYEGYGQVLRWLAETGHRSCLLVTSREVPPEIGAQAGAAAPVRALRLGGLDVMAGRDLLTDRGLVGDAAAWEALTVRYGGNALALQVVGETIGALFGGQIATFLDQGEAVFGDIRRLLEAQLARLSAEERTVLDWLAVEREPVDVATLVADLGPATRRGAALEALDALRRRSLLERGEQGTTVTLQSVVLEHVTDRLVEQVANEIARGQPARLVSHAVIKARARDYVRQSQERLIGEPILERLNVHHGARGVEQQLTDLLEDWRDRAAPEQGYGPGNAVNLLRLLRGHLRGLDLSRLAIRQAYLADVEAQDASLVNVRVAETIFAEAFDFAGSVALSGDGALLAAGTSTGEVHLWRTVDRTPLLVVHGHAGGVRSVALSNDGRLLASGGTDGTVRLWETSTGRPLATMRGHSGAVWSVALSGDDRLLVSGGTDGAVRLWATSTGQSLSTMLGHAGPVWTVGLSADGRLLASGGSDGTVRLWEARSGRSLASLVGHTSVVRSVALSADGHLLATGSEDRTVRLWDTSTGRSLATLRGHTGAVPAVAISADGVLVASGDGDGAVRLWETSSGRPLATLQGHTGIVWSVALTADGSLLASGGGEGTVRLWETSSGRPVATLQGHTGAIRAVALTPDGALLAGAVADGRVQLWETGTGQPLATLQGHTGIAWSVALSADGSLLASGGGEGTVRLWETSSGRPLATLQGHTGAVPALALSADGRLLASGGADGAVRLWETATGRLLATLEGHTGIVWRAALSADGSLLASGCAAGMVRLWETASGRLLAALEAHTGPVLGVRLSPDGHLLVTCGGEGMVRLWETGSGRLLATLEGDTGGVRGVALSEDGDLVAGGGADGRVQLWETGSGRLLATLEGHTGGVRGVALSADGALLASGSLDETVRVWDTRTGACLRTLRAERRYERLDITGLTGITDAQRQALLALGARRET